MRQKPFNWTAGLFIILYHAGLLIGLPLYFAHAPPSAAIITTSLVLFVLCGLSIGVYHRCYSHRAYTLHPAVEGFFLWFSTMSFESSVLRWSHDHRKHHDLLDTDEDPYSIKRGFWYAHMGWIFEKPEPIDEQVVRDLLRKPLLVFQHRYYGILAIATNVITFLVIGAVSGDFLGAFVMCWWVRVLALHHVTWFVNSLAHTWGERTYSRELSAVDNWILAFFTFGEGYHNYHHVFASDYRNGARWYHFDPGKWVVWSLSKIGLASNLRRYQRTAIESRLLKEDYRLLKERLTTLAADHKAVLETRIHELYDQMRTTTERIHRLKAGGKPRREIVSLKRSLREYRRNWRRLCNELLPSKALA